MDDHDVARGVCWAITRTLVILAGIVVAVALIVEAVKG